MYREVVTKDSLDSELFCKIVAKYSNKAISNTEARDVFASVCKELATPTQPDKDYLTWQEFEKSFKMVIPDPEKF